MVVFTQNLSSKLMLLISIVQGYTCTDQNISVDLIRSACERSSAREKNEPWKNKRSTAGINNAKTENYQTDILGIPYSFYAQAKTAFPEKFEQNTSEIIEFKSLKTEELFLATMQQLGRRLNINQTCFISHAKIEDTSKEYIQHKHLYDYYDRFSNTLEKSLAATGFITYFDLRRDPPDRGAAGYRSVDDFHRRAGMADFAITALIPQYKLRFMDTNSDEYKQYIAITIKAETMPSYYVPILLDGDESTSIPPTIYKDKLYERFTDPKKFYRNFFKLLKERLIPTKALFIEELENIFFKQAQAILQGSVDEQIRASFNEYMLFKKKQKEQEDQMLSKVLFSRGFSSITNTDKELNNKKLIENEELFEDKESSRSLPASSGKLNIKEKFLKITKENFLLFLSASFGMNLFLFLYSVTQSSCNCSLLTIQGSWSTFIFSQLSAMNPVLAFITIFSIIASLFWIYCPQ